MKKFRISETDTPADSQLPISGSEVDKGSLSCNYCFDVLYLPITSDAVRVFWPALVKVCVWLRVNCTEEVCTLDVVVGY